MIAFFLKSIVDAEVQEKAIQLSSKDEIKPHTEWFKFEMFKITLALSLKIWDLVLLSLHSLLILLTESQPLFFLLLFLGYFLFFLLFLLGCLFCFGFSEELMTIQFFHFDDKLSSYFRSFRFRLMDYDFLGESQLR